MIKWPWSLYAFRTLCEEFETLTLKIGKSLMGHYSESLEVSNVVGNEMVEAHQSYMVSEGCKDSIQIRARGYLYIL